MLTNIFTLRQKVLKCYTVHRNFTVFGHTIRKIQVFVFYEPVLGLDPGLKLLQLSGLFCLSLISRFYGVGNCWHRLSGVRSKLVNQLSKVSRW